MKSAYRQKLFRLFLAVAVLPASLVAVVGYYLIIQGSLDTAGRSLPAVAVADYFNTAAFDRIASRLDNFRERPRRDYGDLDFVISKEADSVTLALTSPLLSPTAVTRILQSAEGRSRGFVVDNKSVFQYVRLAGGGGKVLYGGIIHDTSYINLIDRLHLETAGEQTSSRLQPKYILFLSLVLVLTAVAGGAFAYVASSRFSRTLAEPLLELSRATERIGRGDFKARIDTPAEGEIAALIERFNLMAKQLEHTARLLAQSERVAAWREVARRFAHELKNPLQPLLVSLYQVEKRLNNHAADNNVREALRAASEEVEHLRNLADRFSHLAKMPPPRFETIDLVTFVRSLVQLYQADLTAREFIFITPTAEVLFETDETYLREILHNLLQNAIDATSPGERVEVRLAQKESRQLIIVSDSGRGMDPVLLSRARLPYVTTKTHGTGLGLAIIERTVNELGGQVEIESKPGRGTTVTVSLPMKATRDA